MLSPGRSRRKHQSNSIVRVNKLSLPDLSPTCMTLELADRLISRPVGVAEDVFVKVGIEGLWLGLEALTGEAMGSMIGEVTGSASSFGLVIVLPGRVLGPEDEAESGVDEPEIGKPKLDKLEVGFDLDYGCLEVGKNYIGQLPRHIRSEVGQRWLDNQRKNEDHHKFHS
nr:reverse transcriptase domain-containing protein [Tanacetum cinerariifolium]